MSVCFSVYKSVFQQTQFSFAFLLSLFYLLKSFDLETSNLLGTGAILNGSSSDLKSCVITFLEYNVINTRIESLTLLSISSFQR